MSELDTEKIKRENFSRIMTGGTSLVERSILDIPGNVTISGLYSPRGEMLKPQTLLVEPGIYSGELTLGLHGIRSSQFYYANIGRTDDIAILDLNLDTFLDLEGAWFGRSMLSLGTKLVEVLAQQFPQNQVFGCISDGSRQRNTRSSRKNWSSAMAVTFGYTYQPDLSINLGFSKAKNIFLKKLK